MAFIDFLVNACNGTLGSDIRGVMVILLMFCFAILLLILFFGILRELRGLGISSIEKVYEEAYCEAEEERERIAHARECANHAKDKY